MNILLKYGILFCLLGQFQTAEAQFLKRLKSRIDKTVDKAIDETFDDARGTLDETLNDTMDSIEGVDSEESKEDKSLNKTDMGSTILTHSKQFGTVQIDELSQINVVKTNNGYEISGNWWSHEADIFDGFNLVIKTTQNLKHEGDNISSNALQTFKIPEEANLKLGYDPQLFYNKPAGDNFRAAVSDDYQNYDISTGEVSIDVLTDDAIQITFSGKVSLQKRIRNGSGSEEYTTSFYESNLIGGIDGVSPKFMDNTTIQNTGNNNQNSGGYSIPQTTSSTAIPGVYNFTFETVVKVTNSEENQSYNMSYLLNPNADYIAIKANMSEYSDDELNGESIIVMDQGNSHIFVETAGMKMQMSSQMMGGQQMSNPTDEMANYDYSNIRKTGNTKTILGATCYEYVMSDSKVRMELWVAPGINLPNWFVQNKEVLDGHIMEYTIDSNDGNMKSETIAINDNISKVIDPKDYRKMF